MVVNVSVKWKFGLSKLMVQRTSYKKSSLLNQMTVLVEERLMRQLLRINNFQKLVFQKPSRS